MPREVLGAKRIQCIDLRRPMDADAAWSPVAP